MDVIESNKRLRETVTSFVDSLLIKFELQTEDEIKNFKRKTIFDELLQDKAM